MSNNIALTASMRSNLLSLQNTQNLMNKTQDRLSTGYKVNSAMDNPSSYFTAQSLNSRANDLSSLLDSIGQAISTLEVADKGITTLQDFVEQAKSIANNARDTSNVPASTSSKVKFDTETLRSALVTDQVNGVNAGTSTMTIRLGEATKLSGTKNVSEETLLSDIGVNVASAGTLTVGSDKFVINGATSAERMTTETHTFAAGEALKITAYDATAKTITVQDNSSPTPVSITISSVDFANITGNTGLNEITADHISDGMTLKASAGATISKTITAEGKTEWQMDDASLWNADATAVTSANQKFDNNVSNVNKIYVKNTGTVADMAKTLENMIGTNRISISVENSNLQMKTLDTSSLEVAPPTSNPFADAFGLDTGDTITLEASDTAESLRQKINNMTFDDGRTVTAEFDTDGHLVVKSAEGDDMVISGDLADKLGVTGSVSNGSNERAIYSKQFDSVLTQIDELVQDTSYKGINLLKGDNLTVNFNESRTSTIELKGVNFDATGLGFTQSANEWRGNADIDKALEQVTKATSMLRAQASEFGQNLSTVQIREDFTKNMINNLQAGADKLTLADMNEEAANMLSLQTRQQLGVNSLSLASQASQSVLKLF